jgi:hypothetical protein
VERKKEKKFITPSLPLGTYCYISFMGYVSPLASHVCTIGAWVRSINLDEVVHRGGASKPMVSMAEWDIALVVLAADVWLQAD